LEENIEKIKNIAFRYSIEKFSEKDKIYFKNLYYKKSIKRT